MYYSDKEILMHLRKELNLIFDQKQFNVWFSKNGHFHLRIRIHKGEIKDDELEKICKSANNVYEYLSDNGLHFNELYNPNVRLITKDWLTADFILLYKDIF